MQDGQSSNPSSLRRTNLHLVVSSFAALAGVVIAGYQTFFAHPFDPKPVKGVSTADPEYLAAIAPDDETFFFTRRFDEAKKGSITPVSVEKFMIAKRDSSGAFTKGEPLPLPFNAANNNNEGGGGPPEGSGFRFSPFPPFPSFPGFAPFPQFQQPQFG